MFTYSSETQLGALYTGDLGKASPFGIDLGVYGESGVMCARLGSM